jgi:hypothetical protein
MEEKRPGQNPDADRPADDKLQSRTTPFREAGTPKDTTPEDLALIHDADERARKSREELARRGFGDHKGTDGF